MSGDEIILEAEGLTKEFRGFVAGGGRAPGHVGEVVLTTALGGVGTVFGPVACSPSAGASSAS